LDVSLCVRLTRDQQGRNVREGFSGERSAGRGRGRSPSVSVSSLVVRAPIYMDHQATTPVDPRVLEAMLPFFREQFGNAASSSHPYGWAARAAVKKAREECAEILGAEPIDIVFT